MTTTSVNVDTVTEIQATAQAIALKMMDLRTKTAQLVTQVTDNVAALAEMQELLAGLNRSIQHLVPVSAETSAPSPPSLPPNAPAPSVAVPVKARKRKAESGTSTTEEVSVTTKENDPKKARREKPNKIEYALAKNAGSLLPSAREKSARGQLEKLIQSELGFALTEVEREKGKKTILVQFRTENQVLDASQETKMRAWMDTLDIAPDTRITVRSLFDNLVRHHVIVGTMEEGGDDG